jgi:3-deoxy-7-phosphoheptulonate synthase
MLDLSVPAYIADLISFAGIGARTTESQPHRALASGLPLPVGFKNGTDGGLQTALDALVSSSRPHSYIGIDDQGRSCIVRTPGNPDCVLILRGGKSVGPNYAASYVADSERQLAAMRIPDMIRIDRPTYAEMSSSSGNRGLARCAA